MHEQYRTRSIQYQMKCEMWCTATSVTNPPTILLVTIETTQSANFHKYMQQLSMSDRLARIIVDEAHLALTHDSFRSVMGTLQWLGSRSIQIVLQTATLPPSLEADLFNVFGISTYLVSRSATCRPNISYTIKRCKRADMATTLAAEFTEAMAMSTTNRVMIFCLSKMDAENTAAQLGIPYCHSEMSQDAIDNLLHGFRAGQVRGIASTSLLGVGLDVPGVTHVFHLDYPRDVLSFAQETGRLGRDSGTPRAWSIVIAPHDSSKPKFPEPDRFGARLLRDAIDNRTLCRRLMVQMFIDGAAEPCSMMERQANLCDNCIEASMTVPERGADSVFPTTLIARYLPNPSS
jgi:superfamily II DNA helicase RecQ